VIDSLARIPTIPLICRSRVSRDHQLAQTAGDERATDAPADADGGVGREAQAAIPRIERA
jgi:hypothetical protein